MADASDSLSGTQRAAVVLLSLGEAQAAEVLRHMDAKDVQKLGVAMATVGDISHRTVERVIGEFADVITQPAKIGDGADEYVRAVLMQALGEERASGVIDRILTGQNTPGLDALKWMEPKAIADLVRHEHPQIIAIVLAHLDGDQGAEVLKCLPEALRGDVLMRVATLDSIPAHALTELNDVMARQFSGTQTAKPAVVGGAKVAASILNFMDAGSDEALLQSISEADGALGDEIRDLMFTFDNLATMEDRTMQAILREVSSDTLALALRGADPRVRTKVTGNMSQRAAEILIDDMESRGPVRLAEVEAAQKEILAQVRKMAESGDITLQTRSEGLRLNAVAINMDNAERWIAPGFGEAPRAVPRVADVPRPPTAAEIEALREAAQQDGHAAGYAAGLAAGEAEIQRRIAQLQGVLDGFTRPLARLDGEVTDALSDLAVRIAGALVGRAYAADPTLLADLVREALDAVGSATREIELRLQPDDFNVLAPHLSGLAGVRVTPDPSLGRGELRLHSEGVRIDGTVAARMQAVLDTLQADEGDAP